MRSISKTVVFLLLQGVMSSCAMQEPTPTIPTPEAANITETAPPSEYRGAATGIQLEKAIHFSAPEGSDLVAAPGRYQLEPTVDAQLRLVPEGEQVPLVIAAAITNLDLEVSAPIALAVPAGEDVQHVILLLPGGMALDGIGSYSGVKARGPITALGGPAMKDPLSAKLAQIPSSGLTAIPKAAEKFERRAADLALQPGPRTTNFQECKMAGSGYVGSVIAQQTVAVKTRGALPLPSPRVGAIASRNGTSIVLAQAPAATPPTPNTGTTTYVTTNPRTPYLRDVPRSYQRCVFGSTVVTATGLLPFQTGERVTLSVVSRVIQDPYIELWIEDTYELTAQAGKPLTFPRAIMAAATAGVPASDWIRWQDLSKRFADRMKTGVPVGFMLTATGKRLVCLYQPDLNNFGQGNVTCAPGMPWPIQQ